MKAIHFPQKNIFRNISLAIFTVATMVSCSTMVTSKSKVGTPQPNIANTQWTLADNIKGNKPTLVIEAAKITGNGGCNRYFGEVMLDRTVGNFSTKNIGSTKMACENMNEETNYFSMLGAATKYVVTGTTLELYKDNLLLMKFNKL
jgi:heat shock protein HslJ